MHILKDWWSVQSFCSIRWAIIEPRSSCLFQTADTSWLTEQNITLPSFLVELFLSFKVYLPGCYLFIASALLASDCTCWVWSRVNVSHVKLLLVCDTHFHFSKYYYFYITEKKFDCQKGIYSWKLCCIIILPKKKKKQLLFLFWTKI